MDRQITNDFNLTFDLSIGNVFEMQCSIDFFR
jgi:hypothetical protein